MNFVSQINSNAKLVTSQSIDTNEPTADNNLSAADELKKFKELLDLGAITQEEFDTQKAKILG
ncbi:SHOCT domain-containing protein [Lactococcus formosensis]|uniref:SHOCT domain-containing protein n=2 Tax=Streptococcaceae TaxID=1300 RepID=UPI0022E79538|nr:SHOCT domain-containing protein [Lactococcus formosensis]